MKLKNLFFALATAVCVATAPAMAQESAETDNSGPLTLTLEQALEIALSEIIYAHCVSGLGNAGCCAELFVGL